MVHYLIRAQYKGGYRFWLQFEGGEEGEVDLEKILTEAGGRLGEYFRKNPGAVKDFYLDPWPTLAWECGYDIAPETLYELYVNQSGRKVAESRGSYDPESGEED